MPRRVVTFEETMPPFSMLRLEYSDGASGWGTGGKLLVLLMMMFVLERKHPVSGPSIPLHCVEMT
jgi:hypothetical protein